MWVLKRGEVVGGDKSILRSRPKGIAVKYGFSGDASQYEKIIDNMLTLLDLNKGDLFSDAINVSIHESGSSLFV